MRGPTSFGLSGVDRSHELRERGGLQERRAGKAIEQRRPHRRGRVAGGEIGHAPLDRVDGHRFCFQISASSPSTTCEARTGSPSRSVRANNAWCSDREAPGSAPRRRDRRRRRERPLPPRPINRVGVAEHDLGRRPGQPVQGLVVELPIRRAGDEWIGPGPQARMQVPEDVVAGGALGDQLGLERGAVAERVDHGRQDRVAVRGGHRLDVLRVGGDLAQDAEEARGLLRRRRVARHLRPVRVPVAVGQVVGLCDDERIGQQVDDATGVARARTARDRVEGCADAPAVRQRSRERGVDQRVIRAEGDRRLQGHRHRGQHRLGGRLREIDHRSDEGRDGALVGEECDRSGVHLRIDLIDRADRREVDGHRDGARGLCLDHAVDRLRRRERHRRGDTRRTASCRSPLVC